MKTLEQIIKDWKALAEEMRAIYVKTGEPWPHGLACAREACIEDLTDLLKAQDVAPGGAAIHEHLSECDKCHNPVRVESVTPHMHSIRCDACALNTHFPSSSHTAQLTAIAWNKYVSEKTEVLTEQANQTKPMQTDDTLAKCDELLKVMGEERASIKRSIDHLDEWLAKNPAPKPMKTDQQIIDDYLAAQKGSPINSIPQIFRKHQDDERRWIDCTSDERKIGKHIGANLAYSLCASYIEHVLKHGTLPCYAPTVEPPNQTKPMQTDDTQSKLNELLNAMSKERVSIQRSIDHLSEWLASNPAPPVNEQQIIDDFLKLKDKVCQKPASPFDALIETWEQRRKMRSTDGICADNEGNRRDSKSAVENIGMCIQELQACLKAQPTICHERDVFRAVVPKEPHKPAEPTDWRAPNGSYRFCPHCNADLWSLSCDHFPMGERGNQMRSDYIQHGTLPDPSEVAQILEHHRLNRHIAYQHFYRTQIHADNKDA